MSFIVPTADRTLRISRDEIVSDVLASGLGMLHDEDAVARSDPVRRAGHLDHNLIRGLLLLRLIKDVDTPSWLIYSSINMTVMLLDILTH